MFSITPIENDIGVSHAHQRCDPAFQTTTSWDTQNHSMLDYHRLQDILTGLWLRSDVYLSSYDMIQLLGLIDTDRDSSQQVDQERPDFTKVATSVRRETVDLLDLAD
jgi:hypothetical protein